MKRRDFIGLLGGTAAWPFTARAQQTEPMRRIGVLMPGAENDPEYQARIRVFQQELQKAGWAEGRNLRIDFRWTNNKSELREVYARELVSFAPDVIFVEPGPSAETLQRLTRTSPIVFITGTDPVAAGYVQSYARPGGNLTGFTVFESSINTKWLQMLKDIAPQVARVAIFRLESFARARSDFPTIAAVARSFSVTPVDLIVQDDAANIERAVDAFAREPNGGLIVPPSNILQTHGPLIVALADRHHLPAVYNDRLFVDAGGLMSYGADRLDIYRRAASYVDRILRGAKPADLPVQAPTKYELFVNVKTAKALGLTISHEFLLNADKVIE
jgi:putative ABC transport system substrate-binding protein